LGRGDGVGRGVEAGTRVERVATVARRIGANRVEDLGEILTTGVIVQIAALGKIIEQTVELGRSSA
jgi:hypothetical protein